MLIVITMVFAYLLGSLSSAVLICKIFKLPDPRLAGSGNPGATNVLRLGGKKLAALTLVGDLVKGLVAIMIARSLVAPSLWGWVGLAALIGHMYPIFFHFKGGKGVATGIGILLSLSLPLALMAIVTWIIIAIVFRYSSLAAIVATLAAPMYAFWLAKIALLPLSVICVLILMRHRHNIKRLMTGTEPKINI